MKFLSEQGLGHVNGGFLFVLFVHQNKEMSSRQQKFELINLNIPNW